MNEPDESSEDRVAEWYYELVPDAEGSDRGDENEPELLDLGLITYGSLLHPEEIRILFPHEELSIEPVKISGYARRFSKSVAEHLRKVEGDQSGVLNVHSEEDEWFNGLLVGPVSRMGLRKYAFREREYDITSVSFEQIDFYTGDESIIDRLDTVHTCLLDPDGETPAFEPVPDYLDLCLDGTDVWGEDFRKDFLETTWVKGRKLGKYLGS